MLTAQCSRALGLAAIGKRRAAASQIREPPRRASSSTPRTRPSRPFRGVRMYPPEEPRTTLSIGRKRTFRNALTDNSSRVPGYSSHRASKFWMVVAWTFGLPTSE